MSGHSKWANIKHKKARVDAQRGSIFTKMSREIAVAARQGGSNPDTNFRLKIAIQKAKEANIPNDNIQRAIQKGSGEMDGASYEEIVYEGYGPGGFAVLLDIMTDNRNRTAGDIRHLFSKNGGNLGETGCVNWMFEKKAYFVIDCSKESCDEELLMELALDAGAEDVRFDEGLFEITSNPELFEDIEKALSERNIATEQAEITMLPNSTISLSEEDAAQAMKLLEALENHDDVQNVYANLDVIE
jgi:YebC/PmpR family DNA-binding regulatory protein